MYTEITMYEIWHKPDDQSGVLTVQERGENGLQLQWENKDQAIAVAKHKAKMYPACTFLVRAIDYYEWSTKTHNHRIVYDTSWRR